MSWHILLAALIAATGITWATTPKRDPMRMPQPIADYYKPVGVF